MPSFFKSQVLQEIETNILKHIASDRTFTITLPNGTKYDLSEPEMQELRSFFGVANTALVRQQYESSNTTQLVVAQRQQDDKFRREIERTLFRSIYPSNWQMGMLIRELNMFINWKDKRQRAIVVPYEPYILRALKSLQERKRKWDEKIGWPSKTYE